jgi:hypothetical protein
LQGNQAPHPTNWQIRLLRHVQSISPFNGFGILHGRRFTNSAKWAERHFLRLNDLRRDDADFREVYSKKELIYAFKISSIG